jgi:hypothetical protein
MTTVKLGLAQQRAGHDAKHLRSCALLMDSRIAPGHEIPMFAGVRFRTHLWE